MSDERAYFEQFSGEGDAPPVPEDAVFLISYGSGVPRTVGRDGMIVDVTQINAAYLPLLLSEDDSTAWLERLNATPDGHVWFIDDWHGLRWFRGGY